MVSQPTRQLIAILVVAAAQSWMARCQRFGQFSEITFRTGDIRESSTRAAPRQRRATIVSTAPWPRHSHHGSAKAVIANPRSAQCFSCRPATGRLTDETSWSSVTGFTFNTLHRRTPEFRATSAFRCRHTSSCHVCTYACGPRLGAFSRAELRRWWDRALSARRLRLAWAASCDVWPSPQE